MSSTPAMHYIEATEIDSIPNLERGNGPAHAGGIYAMPYAPEAPDDLFDPPAIEAWQRAVEAAPTIEARVLLMCHLAESLRQVDPVQGREVVREMQALAVENNYQPGIAAALYAEGASLQSSDPDAAIRSLARATAIAVDEGAGTIERFARRCLGVTLLYQGAADSGIEHLERALEIAIEEKDMLAQIYIWQNLGSSYASVDAARAERCFENMTALWRELGSRKGVVEGLCYLAAINADFPVREEKPRNAGLAIEYAAQALPQAQELGQHTSVWLALYSLCTMHAYLQEHEQAIVYAHQLLGQTDAWLLSHEGSHGVWTNQALFRNIQARCSIARSLSFGGSPESIQPWLDSVMEIIPKLGEQRMMIAAYGWLADACSNLDSSLSLEYLQRGLECAESLESGESISRMCAELADLHARQGRFEQAYTCLVRSIATEQETAASHSGRKLATLRILHETSLLQRQAEIERLRAGQLQQQLERQRAELAAQAMHAARQAELLGRFRNEIRAIVREADRAETAIRAIREKLKEMPCEAINWSKFEVEFQQSYPDFRDRLTSRHPELTKMEVKICSMLKLRLTSNDIARLFCLSERSVENHRYNIRKKLAVAKGETVQDLLDRL